MGREIRIVPKGWEHPKKRDGSYQPMRDTVYAERAREWLDECKQWDDGTHPSLVDRPELKAEIPFFWEWDGGPPDHDYYRDAWTEEPTCYQMYETVSEGTPVTPVFETEDELVDYLVNVGTFWNQKYSREAAEAFVKTGWAPSFVMLRAESGAMKFADGVTAAGWE